MEDSVSQSNNLLGWDLLMRICEKEIPAKGVSVSPLSIGIALAMLAGGAKDADRKQLCASLGLDDPKQLTTAFSSLQRVSQDDTLSVANAVFGDRTFSISPKYAKHIETFSAYVDTTFESLSGDVERINTWISDNTRGMIPHMLTEAMLAQSHVVLVNALAFKAIWQNKFDPKSTTKEYKFHTTGDRTHPVDMMFLHDHHILVHRGHGYTSARLPFAASTSTSQRMSLIAYLPDLGRSLQQLLPDVRQGAIETNFLPTKLSIFGFPKLDINTDLEILRMLKDLQFPLSNDFPEMGSGSNFVDQIIHSTAITLDEEGVTAAAATAVVMKRRRLVQSEYLIFDRPFAFTIVADDLNLVLFAGLFSRA